MGIGRRSFEPSFLQRAFRRLLMGLPGEFAHGLDGDAGQFLGDLDQQTVAEGLRSLFKCLIAGCFAYHVGLRVFVSGGTTARRIGSIKDAYFQAFGETRTDAAASSPHNKFLLLGHCNLD